MRASVCDMVSERSNNMGRDQSSGLGKEIVLVDSDRYSLL